MHFYNESNSEGEKHSLIFLLTAQLFLALYIVGVYGLVSIKQPILFLFCYESKPFQVYSDITHGSVVLLE